MSVRYLALIHHGQKFTTKLFPRHGYRFSRFQTLHSTRHLLVPCLLDEFIRAVKAIEQSIR